MDFYLINPAHVPGDVTFTWFGLGRACCTCGWRTRWCFLPDTAADLLIGHMMRSGIAVPADEKQAS